MMKLKHDFQNKSASSLGWYDLREDWVLIESSLAKQYGLRIRNEADMPWGEFCTLISGLMPDTPLGQIVSIRSETDLDTIRNFTSDQSSIYNKWQSKKALVQLENTEQLDRDMQNLSSMFASMFGKKV